MTLEGVNPPYIPPTSSTCSPPLLAPASPILTLTSTSTPTSVATSSAPPVGASLLMAIAPGNSLFIKSTVGSDLWP
ncbi:hypothetical protein H5410_000048 [Solanum commersonii]|uniref:Uncharacterized protein n=1 Tax=Solanum commersonii TaxID=4109 RepID=A0A9J6AVQ0_SOLCO|nr:hypothetical protein H5410_000048 [Solanum commersonii]